VNQRTRRQEAGGRRQETGVVASRLRHLRSQRATAAGRNA
jgi:hypothetical protein